MTPEARTLLDGALMRLSPPERLTIQDKCLWECSTTPYGHLVEAIAQALAMAPIPNAEDVLVDALHHALGTHAPGSLDP